MKRAAPPREREHPLRKRDNLKSIREIPGSSATELREIAVLGDEFIVPAQ
jgi:hypothetical protein